MLEKTLESPLDCKEIKPVNPKGSQQWIFIKRTDAESLILWPPEKNQLLRKDPDAGQDWRQEEKGMAEDKMVGWCHWFSGHEFEQVPGDGEAQGAWHTAVCVATKSQTWLRHWTIDKRANVFSLYNTHKPFNYLAFYSLIDCDSFHSLLETPVPFKMFFKYALSENEWRNCLLWLTAGSTLWRGWDG